MAHPRGYWTQERCMADALQYTTRGAWSAASPCASTRARKRGWFDACVAHMVSGHKVWTKEDCIASALRFSTRNAWMEGAQVARKTAGKNGWLADCWGHMPVLAGKPTLRGPKLWSLEQCREHAAQFTTRQAWVVGHHRTYDAAARHGWLDRCSEHMGPGLLTDNDTVYIWQAVGETYNGKNVYKIGVTSARLGDKRVRMCATKNSQTADVVVLQPIKGSARELESILHILGDDPQYSGIDGYSEFRALSDSELNEAIELIQQEAA